VNIITSFREFKKDENAVSEEFTSLPALSVVMIGFAIFILLIANTYSAYSTRIQSLDKYQTADFIATKLTNPESFVIKEGGVIDLELLKNSEAEINELRNKYRASGVDFVICVSYEDIVEKIPSNADDLLSNTVDRVAVTKNIGVYINQAQTKPGRLTIITWSV
jgi:hypothetical protein